MSARAVVYLRVSSRGQAEKGAGLASQQERANEYAEREGIEVVEVVRESASGAVKEGEFSSVDHRPVLRSLLDRAERGEFELLIVASYDRLSREQFDLQLLKRWFLRLGVACVSAAGEPNGSNGAGGAIAELLDTVIGAIHSFERKRILERVAAGKTQKRREGKHVSGQPPYGYRLAGDGNYETVPERVPIVRGMFEAARDGHGPARIARDLNRREISSPRGGAWSRQTVAKLLANPAYCGELHGVKGSQPKIISRQLYNTVQARLANEGESPEASPHSGSPR